MSTSFKQSERDAQFKNQWLGFFSTLNWEKVIQHEGGLKGALGKSYSFKGSYLEVQRFPNGKQNLKIDGKEVSSPYRSIYGGPSASGSQVERAQVYEDAKRLSSTLGTLSVQGKEDPLAAARALLRVLTKEKGSLAEFQLVHRNATLQAPNEWTMLCSEFGNQVEARAHVIGKVNGNEEAKEELLAKVTEKNYYNFERKTLEKQFPKILVSEGYKPVPLKTISPEKLSSIKGQANMVEVAQKLTKQIAIRVPMDDDKTKFQFEMPCPFSKVGEGHTLTMNGKGWSSSNPKVVEEAQRDVIGFVRKYRDCDFTDAVKEVAEMINIPVSDKDYVQSKDPAYDKGKTRLYLKYVEQAEVFKFNRKDVGDNKPTFGRVMDFLEFEKGFEEKQGRDHVISFLKKNWLDEEKEAFIEQALKLPGGKEALAKSDSLAYQLNETLLDSLAKQENLKFAAEQSLADEIKQIGKQHGVEVDLSSSPSHSQEFGRENSVDISR